MVPNKNKTENHSVLLFSIVIVVAAIVSVWVTVNINTTAKPSQIGISSSESTTGMAAEIFGVKIQKNPHHSTLTELGVFSWPKWGCQPSKFPWTFTATETMYLLEGKVKVYVDGYQGSFEIGRGDLVVFSKGMKVTWDVLEAVSKHYSLEK